ncbi:MAG: hypothetical protein ACE5NN_03420 [Candidatus Bathyarchaeia archaeon]
MSRKREVQGWIISLLDDPIAKILRKNSNLTKIQLETFLIDILAEKIADEKLVYEEKAKLRLLKSGVTRGAFNRTLRQARKNVIRSIYTIVLLGYLGILESPQLEPYIKLANKLHTYMKSYRRLLKDGEVEEQHRIMIRMLQRELEEGLRKLLQPKSMSGRRDL